jgi:class 3 adenylate cyclase/tetratricopeptide (TPR) repeat protein
MRCSKCGSDNREGCKFCTTCGTPLVASCPQCGASVESSERFCGECGTALGDAAPAAAAADMRPVTVSVGGERRHLTVLFCDLVGSTEIALRLDPEEWSEMIAAYHRAAAEAITRYGGHVAQYLGDGVMAYFGWPQAHDNDGERAARAALAMLDVISKLNEQQDSLPSKGGGSRPKLTARVGIDSGAVVVDIGAGSDAEVFGETPNIAARLQATAAPGTVLIAAATHRLLSGLFVVEALGSRTLKGITTPLEVFQVIRPTGVRGRLGAARGLTPFVGREEEMRLLLSRWERAREGEGQLALIIGEPGIGKSRLVAEFHNRIRDAPHIWMESAGEQFFENTPFHAISEMLSQWLELQDAANTEEQFERLERALASAGLKVAETAPLIADLLQLSAGERYPTSTLTGEQKRQRLLAALSGWALGAAKLQPLLRVVEDLHWLDPSTLELLQLLAEQGATVPVMLLYTARPEFRAPWPMRAHHTQLTLNRLGARNVREMLTQVAAHSVLADETVDTLIERTGGVPLFVEELTRAVLESSSAKLTGHEIPVTLHDSLMARLDRLGPAKEVAQVGALIGGEFSYDLLHAVHTIPEADLQQALRHLADAELLYVRGIAPEATYQFKHALIRDAAYGTLLKSRRRELHTQVAQTIEKRSSEREVSHPEIVAYHYTEAGLIAQAVPYWRKAGRAAIARSAHVEAIAHLKHGLELLGTLPHSPERVTEELRLQLMLTTPLAATLGYTHAELEETCNRARDLCGQENDSPQLLAVLGRLFSIYYNRGELTTASELTRRMLALAERVGDNRLLLWAHYSMGFNLQAQGDFLSARFHMEQSIALYQPEQSAAYDHDWVQHPGPTALGMLAYVLYTLGYPDQALQRAREALAMARAQGHSFTLAWVLGPIVGVLLRRGDYREAKELAEERIALCAEQGFLSLLSLATAQYGFVLVLLGHSEEGARQIRQGLAVDSRTPHLRLHQCLPARALARIGRSTEAFSILTGMLPVFEQTSNSSVKADFYILKGNLLLVEGASHRAEAAENYGHAIELARLNSDRMTELEATTHLARLLDQQQRRDEARTMLTEIYSWFTEGFDTADLKDAKALLHELAT